MKFIHFADLHLGVETYGKLNSETGLSTRLEDFLNALDQLVEYALREPVDLVIFSGDSYKSREPGQTQQREFARRLRKLGTGGIPVFLLVGNHDMHNARGRATSTEIFDTLAVENIYVSGRPDLYRIPTKHGEVQVVSLPWLRRSALLSKEETGSLDFAQINERMQQALTQQISKLAQQLDPSLPSILSAHVWVFGASTGTESGMTIGQEHSLLLSTVASPSFDYVALGHIHKQQVLNEHPPVVYSGSLERLDFGDEKLEKGFYVVDIDTNPETGLKTTSYRFQPVQCRRFLTVAVTVAPDDLAPTTTVLQELHRQSEQIRDAIVRLNISVPESLAEQFSDAEIREAMKSAHSWTMTRTIVRENSPRAGNTQAEQLQPAEALRQYIEMQEYPEEYRKLLQEYGERMIYSQSGDEKEQS